MYQIMVNPHQPLKTIWDSSLEILLRPWLTNSMLLVQAISCARNYPDRTPWIGFTAIHKSDSQSMLNYGGGENEMINK
jgi:hypothetical protein